MAEQSTPSKAQLIETLRSTGAETAARLRSLPPGAFEQGRYENGWNGRQIRAHPRPMGGPSPRLFALAREASTPRPAAPPGATPGRGMTGGINDYNERQVEKRAGASVAELIEEFETNPAAPPSVRPAASRGRCPPS